MHTSNYISPSEKSRSSSGKSPTWPIVILRLGINTCNIRLLLQQQYFLVNIVVFFNLHCSRPDKAAILFLKNMGKEVIGELIVIQLITGHKNKANVFYLTSEVPGLPYTSIVLPSWLIILDTNL